MFVRSDYIYPNGLFPPRLLRPEMLARRLLLRPLLPPLARMPTAPPRRHALHLPLIVGAGKVLAGAGLKKLALNSVVRKLGPQRVLSEMHAANRSLHAAQPEVYTAEMFNATHDGLRLFERSLQGLHEQEQLLRAWGWFERLEKDNPSLAQVLLKTYLCLLYTSPSPRDRTRSRMPSSA